jgi:hypothetical protein
VSDGNDKVDVIQNSTAGVPPDGASHCFELDTEGSNVKFGLLFPLESLVAAELFAAGDDRVCSIQFKYKATSGVQNIRAQVLSFTGSVDELVDPISNWNAGTADLDPTYVASWTPENSGTQIATGTDWATYTLENVAIDTSGAVNVALLIHVADIDLLAGTDKIYIADVHMNEGGTVSDYRRPTIRQERDECFRFMQTSFSVDTEPDTQQGRAGALTFKHWTGSNIDEGVLYHYVTPMHKSPTLQFYNPVNNNFEWFEDNQDNNNGVVTVIYSNSKSAFFQAVNTSGPGSGDITLVHFTGVAEIIP